MALILNGTSSKLEWTGNLFGQTLPYSFLIWVKPAEGALTANGWPIGWGVNGGGELGIQFAGNDAGDPVMAHARSSSDVTDWTCSVSPMVAGEWKPALAVFTSTTSRTIYYDGKSFTSTSNVPITWGDFNRLTIGVRARTGDGFFNGEVAHACVWNTALTAEDYAAILTAENPSTIKSGNVVEYWPLTTQAATQTGLNGRVLTASNTAQGTDPVMGAGSAPTGTVSIDTITPSTNSATVAYTYSASDQTGFEYRLNAGTAATIGTSPATITGLTPNTTYALQIRAVNAAGSGTWSTSTNFTTAAIVVPSIQTVEFKNNTGTLLQNVTVNRVWAVPLTSQHFSNLVTGSDGRLTITDAALVPGTQYLILTSSNDGLTVGVSLGTAS